MPGAGNNDGGEAAQADFPGLQGRGPRHGRGEEALFIRESPLRRPGPHVPPPEIARIGFVHRKILRQQEYFTEPPAAQGMVVVAVGQDHGKGPVRKPPHKRAHVLRAVARIHQQRPVRARQQRHAHAHGVPDMKDAGQHFLPFKRHVHSSMEKP